MSEGKSKGLKKGQKKTRWTRAFKLSERCRSPIGDAAEDVTALAADLGVRRGTLINKMAPEISCAWR